MSVVFFFQDKSEQEQELRFATSHENYWLKFAEITRERTYIEEVGTHYLIPVFSPTLLSDEGTEITLTGYYLPYSRQDSVIILSRYPNASCFFCGQAGIESVAMVELVDLKTYKTDQRLTVRGKLQLNNTDVDRLAFIIKEAEVEEL